MTPENFCYWLQGYLELTNFAPGAPAGLSQDQLQAINDHLALVLTKVTPEPKKKEKESSYIKKLKAAIESGAKEAEDFAKILEAAKLEKAKLTESNFGKPLCDKKFC